MASLSHNPPRPMTWLVLRELWTPITICVIWLAVLFDAVFGPDFVSYSNSGSVTRIPSAIFVALFAFLATKAVAKYGYGRRNDDN